MADSRWLTASRAGAGLSIGSALAKCKSVSITIHPRGSDNTLSRKHFSSRTTR